MISIKHYYYELRYRLLREWWSLFDTPNNVYCDVLMFHHVSDTHVDINESCQCTRAQFSNILSERLEHGYQFINIGQLSENMRLNVKGKYCSVTFDDVPDNFYANALPILEKFQIPFCLFITTDFMNKPGYLSPKDVLSLSTHPLCTIGAHTITHPQLRYCGNSYNELKLSKEELERIIGKDVRYLAYPYGRQSSISHKVRAEAKKIGYELAFSTIPTSINPLSKNSKFFLPRMLK